MKYYKAEDVIKCIAQYIMTDAKRANSNACGIIEDYIELTEAILADLPTIEVSEENELKFYYVESIDDYWIGQRLDNFYYAEWNDRLGFVWTHSRYLPWGEHVVAEDTLWKEHTYPSEPIEIPFTEWIVGFMKKYGSKVSEDCDNCIWDVCNYNKIDWEVSEDCISREYLKSFGYINKGDFNSVETIREWIDNAPSVVPSRAEGEWVGVVEYCKHLEEETGERYQPSGMGNTIYCNQCWSEATKRSDYCPDCGAKMKGVEQC